MLYQHGIAILGMVVLAGCSVQGGMVAPVEDRTVGNHSSRGNEAIRQNESVQQGGPEIKPYIATPVSPEPIPASIIPPTTTQDSSKPVKNSPAINSLVGIANTSIQGGQYDKAANSLERALRHDPQNAELWSRLAEVNLLQHDYKQAESKALKSNALVNGDKSLMAANWRLISKARRLRGDFIGADEAEVKAYQLSK